MKETPQSVADWCELLETRHPQEIQLGLSRITQVADKLNLLTFDATIIVVGGTNGKGSTVALLETIYSEAGYSVASYTSPHVIYFNERIKINQKPIADCDLIQAFEKIECAREDLPLTYFEVTTLAALLYFHAHPLDVIILEVGLGGRLDATNIIDSDLAIITTVDFDHEAFLGSTRNAIGYEKAGILRPNKPFIYADNDMPSTVQTQAFLLNTPTYHLMRDYHYSLNENTFAFSYQQDSITIPIPNIHPNSVAAALMATYCLETVLPLTRLERQRGIKKTTVLGRFQTFHHPCLIILDIAHNPQAARHFASCLKKKIKEKQKVHAVFSALSDKNIPNLIAPFKPYVDYWYPSLLLSKRAASLMQLRDAFASNEIKPLLWYNSPELAFQAACKNALPHDLIIVYGSFLMVSATLLYKETI